MDKKDYNIVKILMEYIAKTTGYLEDFIDKYHIKLKHIEITVEPSEPIAPFEKLIELFEIEDENVADEFYEEFDEVMLNKEYTDEKYAEFFNKYVKSTTNVNDLIYTLFYSLVDATIEQSILIKLFESRNEYISSQAQEVHDFIPSEEILREIGIFDELLYDKFTNELFLIIDNSTEKENDIKEFLIKYQIIQGN